MGVKVGSKKGEYVAGIDIFESGYFALSAALSDACAVQSVPDAKALASKEESGAPPQTVLPVEPPMRVHVPKH